MAEELLGVDFEIHGGGSDLVFPHHENEAAQTRAARGEPLARIWMHNGMVQIGRARRWPSRSATSPAARGAGRVRPRRAGHVLARRPLPPADGVLGGARSRRRPRACGAIREAARRLVPGRRRRTWRRCASASSTRWPTTSTPPRRWPRCSTGSARPTGARRRRRRDDLREMLDVLGLDDLLDARTREAAPAEVEELLDAPRGGARGARLRRGRPPARRARGARAGTCATGPTGSSSSAR